MTIHPPFFHLLGQTRTLSVGGNLFLSLFVFVGLSLFAGCDKQSTTDVATGTIQLESDVRGTMFTVNGESQSGTIKVPVGNHLVIATKRGYKAVRKSVAVMENDNIRLRLDPEPVRGYLLVQSDPPGVEVTMDSISIGKTPTFVPDCPLGKHTLRVREAGFFEKSQAIDLTDGRPQKVMLELRRDSGSLDITTTPPGAEVQIDGSGKGSTPLSLNSLASGKYEVRIMLEGYEDVKTTVVLRPGEEEIINENLIAIPGSLKVITIPDEARVYLDNEFQGISPRDIADLEPGEYRIKVELPGYETDARSVMIENGQINVQEFRLEGNSGSLQIVTEPAGVTVSIDGNPMGKTKPGISREVSQVMLIEGLPKGTHKLTLVKPTYGTLSGPIEIMTDEITTKKVVLKRQFVLTHLAVIETPTGTDTFQCMKHENDDEGHVVLERKKGIFVKLYPSEIISLKELSEVQAPATP